MGSFHGFVHALRGERPLLVILIAFASLAAVTVGWGLPDGATPLSTGLWAIDAIGPVEPLSEAYQRFTRDGTENVIYPLFHYIVLTAAYAPYVVFASLTGALRHPSSEFPYGATEPEAFFQTLSIIGNLVSVAMAIGIVLIVFDVTRRLFDVRAARWAAAFSAFLAPLVYYAGTTNLDVPYLFWTLLAIRALLQGASDGRLGYFVFSGVAAGLAVATKDQAVGYFALWPLVIPVLVARLRRQDPQDQQAWRALLDRRTLAAGVAVIATYAIANNLLLGGWQGFIRHLEFISTFREINVHLGAAPTFGGQAALSIEAAEQLLWMMGPLTLLLAIVGVWRSVRTRRWLPLLLLAFAASYYVFIVMPTLAHSRYLIGIALLLAPFAGHAVAASVEQSVRVAWLTRGAGFAALATEVVLCLHLANVLLNDSRYAMERWVRANVAERSTIESQTQPRYLPRLGDRFNYATVGNSFDAVSYELLGGELTPAGLQSRSPPYVMILMASGLSGDPQRTDEPRLRQYFSALVDGSLGYDVVARFQTPNYLPFRQITAGTQPTTILLRRRPD
jgi:4-amino-4-deoxy-L-arabinose transferase-like glycosyltransferase